MSHLPNYKRATNAAYEILAKVHTFSISTNVFAIVEEILENCCLFTYSQANFLYDFSIQTMHAVSEYGFSIMSDSGKRIILYNEEMPFGCIRFTIAHEIGHAVLGHRDEDDPSSEKEANCFARNLLCPIPIAEALDALTVEDYVSLFSITPSMATITFNWRESDKYYLDQKLASGLTDMLWMYLMGFSSVDEYMQYVAL